MIPHVTQLLLEWEADVYLKNRVSKTALELIRNSDLKSFLESMYLACHCTHMCERVRTPI